MRATCKQILCLLGGLTLAAGSGWAEGTPALGKSSQWGSASISWDISSDQRVVGRVQGPFPCARLAGQPVVEGEFEGSVLVGTVKLCQEGEGCASIHVYPFFGFLNRQDGSITANVRLDKGCRSAALNEGRILLTARKEALKPPKAGESRIANAHTMEAQGALEKGDFEHAMDSFRSALDADEDRVVVLQGMGEVEMRRGKPKAALEDYRGALSLREDAETYYNVACAQMRLKDKAGALQNLKKAVAKGFRKASLMAKDPDLSALHADPQFQGMLRQLNALSKTDGRRP